MPMSSHRLRFGLGCTFAILFSPWFGALPRADDSVQTDTAIVFLKRPITVYSERLESRSTEFPFEKDRFVQLLRRGGFQLINRGAYFAQDVQAEGFKRNDIAIVLDGERHHSACPNRMDNPLVRANGFEMEAIELDKTSRSVQSGLGGIIAYRRATPGAQTVVRGGLTQSAGATESGDYALSVTSRRQRLAGRYARGRAYKDGDGRSFADLYAYAGNTRYTLAEASLSGMQDSLSYHAEIIYTEDVMFPYLEMDERFNRMFSGSAGLRGHKLYATYTDHVMDNGLRVAMGGMRTDATSLTVGASSSFYDVYYRHWNSDNVIVTPMGRIDNHLIPDVDVLAAALAGEHEVAPFSLWGRIGLSRHSMGDNARLGMFTPVHPDAGDTRTFAQFAAGAAVSPWVTPESRATVSLDAVSEAPSPEQLYIAVKRPADKPWWVGNPTLAAPLRASLRARVTHGGWTAELSGSHVWNYPELLNRSVGEQVYRTYQNIDAILCAAILRGEWRYFDLAAEYTWAESRTNKGPLAEIAPFSLVSTFKSPSYQGVTVYARHTYNDSQTRVDPALGETVTTSWHRLDMGIKWRVQSVAVTLDIENIGDETYHQHLSYARNPYASGFRVYEPGRSIRLSLVLNSSS